jgi:hypothetical protein
MSRTQRGSKRSGYDYWSKRPYSGRGYGSVVKKLCHSAERMQEKEMLQNILKDEENLVEHKSIVVYPLSDHRVLALAKKEWGSNECNWLLQHNTHYHIQGGWFCRQGDQHWEEYDLSVGNYDDYLKEQSNVN